VEAEEEEKEEAEEAEAELRDAEVERGDRGRGRGGGGGGGVNEMEDSFFLFFWKGRFRERGSGGRFVGDTVLAAQRWMGGWRGVLVTRRRAEGQGQCVRRVVGKEMGRLLPYLF
jgi:hypothetical protein